MIIMRRNQASEQLHNKHLSLRECKPKSLDLCLISLVSSRDEQFCVAKSRNSDGKMEAASRDAGRARWPEALRSMVSMDIFLSVERRLSWVLCNEVDGSNQSFKRWHCYSVEDGLRGTRVKGRNTNQEEAISVSGKKWWSCISDSGWSNCDPDQWKGTDAWKNKGKVGHFSD